MPTAASATASRLGEAGTVRSAGTKEPMHGAPVAFDGGARPGSAGLDETDGKPGGWSERHRQARAGLAVRRMAQGAASTGLAEVGRHGCCMVAEGTGLTPVGRLRLCLCRQAPLVQPPGRDRVCPAWGATAARLGQGVMPAQRCAGMGQAHLSAGFPRGPGPARRGREAGHEAGREAGYEAMKP